jgi:hypothetical protein
MISSNLAELAGTIDFWDLLSYLTQTGWTLVDDELSRFVTFLGPRDINNSPIEIVFFRKQDSPEQISYISNALDILSSVTGLSPAELSRDINTVNKDVLRVRVQGPSLKDGIPLRSASQQIYELKQLVAYAARSEIDRKPYYLNAQHQQSRNMVEAYQFGHTFKGSFGFSIETPKLIDIYRYKQLSLLPQIVSETTTFPLWRRVMERIARGLVYTQMATIERDPKYIIGNYEEGLNANMCQALANMFTGEFSRFEYSIKWAQIKPPEDPLVRNLKSIDISASSYHQLTYAAEELIDTHQEEAKIRGLVIELSAKDSPMALDTSRTIRIRWIEESEGKTYEATATLSVEDYQKAIRAHREWRSVEITGLLSHKKNNWRFVEYSSFRVLDDNFQ